MAQMRNPAVFVYSKGGHTARAANALADLAGADCVALSVRRYRTPLFWVPRAIYDVARRATPPLVNGIPDVASRPWIVIAGPIWAQHMAPPVRSALMALSGSEIPVGILSTSGDQSPPETAHAGAREALGRALVGAVNIENALDGTEDMTTRLRGFAEAMRRVSAMASHA